MAKQVIMSHGASCENFANGEVPATDNFTDMDQNNQNPKRGSKFNKEASRLYAGLCEPILKFFIFMIRNDLEC